MSAETPSNPGPEGSPGDAIPVGPSPVADPKTAPRQSDDGAEAAFYGLELDEAALKGLAASGALVATQLGDGLWHGNAAVRRNAAHALAVTDLDPSGAVALLPIHSRDADPVVRKHCASALGRGAVPAKATIPALLARLVDPVEAVVEAAEDAIVNLAAGTDGAMHAGIVAGFAHRNKGVCARLDRLVGRFGPTIHGAFVAVVAQDGDGVAAAARAALVTLGSSASAAMIAGLGSPEIAVQLGPILVALAGPDPVLDTELQRAAASGAGAERARQILVSREAVQGQGAGLRFSPPDAGFISAAGDAPQVAAWVADHPEPGFWLGALSDSSALVRANGAKALGVAAAAGDEDARFGAALSLGALSRDLMPDVRSAALRGLMGLGGGHGAEAWMVALDDPDKGLREALASDLGAVLGQELARALAMVPAALSTVGRAAVGAALAGSATWDMLAQAAQDAPSAATREVAIHSLGAAPNTENDSDAGVRAALASGLADPVDAVRLAALGALIARGPAGPDLRAAIGPLTRDSAPDLRRQARVAAAITAGIAAPNRLPRAAVSLPVKGFAAGPLDASSPEMALAATTDPAQLVAWLQDGRSHLRANAARALGLAVSSAPAPEAMEAIGGLIRDAEPFVRQAAAEVLGAQPIAARPAAPALAVGLRDGVPEVAAAVGAAFMAIVGSTPELIVAALAAVPATEPDPVLAIVDAVGGPLAAPLAAALDYPFANVRILAAKALELLDERGAANHREALEAARDRDPVSDVRAAAERALDALDGLARRPPPVREPVEWPIKGFAERALAPEVAGNATLWGEASWVDALADAVADGRAHLRRNAVIALGSLGPEACAALVPALRDPVVAVREAAIAAVANAASEAPELWGDTLVAALADVDAIATPAHHALVALGAAAVPAWVRGLEGPEGSRVANALADADGAVVPALARALQSAAPMVRLRALTQIGALDVTRAEGLRSELRIASGDAETDVRQAAQRALDRLDGRGPAPEALESVPMPIAGFDTHALDAKAVAALGAELGTKDGSARLLRWVADGRSFVRANAIQILGFMGPAAPAGAGSLAAAAVVDRAPEVRLAAVDALRTLVPFDEALTPWSRVLADRDGRVVEAAIAALRAGFSTAPDLQSLLLVAPEQFAREGAPIINAVGFPLVVGLAASLTAPLGLMRLHAASGLFLLARRGASDGQDALEIAAEGDPVADVRRAARDALDAIAGARPMPPAFFDPTPWPVDGFAQQWLTRELIAPFKKALSDDGLRASLRSALSHGVEALRQNAAHAFAALGPDASGSAPWLAAALKDSSPAVRAAAAIACGALGDSAADVVSGPLIAALGDTEASVRADAAAGLAALGASSARAITAGLSGPRASIIADHLIAEGEAARPAIIAAASAPVEAVRIHALRVIAAWPTALAATFESAVSEALDDRSGRVRAAAQEAMDRVLGREPPPLVLDPIELPTDDFAAGPLSGDALQAIGSGFPLDTCLRLLSDGRDWVRVNSATLLGRSGQEVVAGPLLMGLRDPFIPMRLASIHALDALGETAIETAIEGWSHAALDGAAAVQSAALDALNRACALAPKKVWSALVHLAPDPAARVLIPLADIQGADAVPLLAAHLASEFTFPRINAAVALGRLALRGAAGQRDALEAALDDGVADVRVAAKATLDAIDGAGRAGPDFLAPAQWPDPKFATDVLGPKTLAAAAKALIAEGRVRVLTRALSNNLSVVRINGAATLGAVGADAGAWLGGLGGLLHDPDPAVRRAAALALGGLKAIEPELLDRLMGRAARALGDRDPDVVGALVDALMGQGVTGHHALLRSALSGAGRECQVARNTLPRFVKQAVPLLIEALDAASESIRFETIVCLGGLGVEAKSALSVLDALVARETETRVRFRALVALREVQGLPAAAAVREARALPDPDFAEKRLPAKALKAAALGLEAADITPLIADGRSWVRANAAGMLAEMKATDPDAIAAVLVLVRDPTPAVREAAAGALKVLKGEASLVVPSLLNALGRALGTESDALIAAITAHKAKGVAAVMEALKQRPERVVPGVSALIRNDPKTYAKAVGAVVTEQSHTLARENAIAALADAKSASEPATKNLVGAMGDAELSIAVAAVVALRFVAKREDELIAQLWALYKTTEEAALHRESADTLRYLGERVPFRDVWG